MELKDIIIDRMKELNINNEDLAKRMGVAPSTTLRYIKGDITNIRRDKIKKLSDALDLDVSYLMGWKEYKQPTKIVQDLELASWMRTLLTSEDEDLYKLLKIISQLDDDKIKTLLVMAEALDK